MVLNKRSNRLKEQLNSCEMRTANLEWRIGPNNASRGVFRDHEPQKIAPTVPSMNKWLTRNKSHHLQLLYWQISVRDDAQILSVWRFFPLI